MASPVPRCSTCSTNSMARPGGACSTRVLVTHSARWPDHHDDPVDRQLGQGVEDVQDHGATAQPVQGLGTGRAHPGAVPGGQHHGRERPARGRSCGRRPGGGGLPVVGRALGVGADHHGATAAAIGNPAVPTTSRGTRSCAYSSHVDRTDATRCRHTSPDQGISEPMPVLPTAIDPASDTFRANETALARGPRPRRGRAGRRPGPAGASGTSPATGSGASSPPGSGSNCWSTATPPFLELCPFAAWGTAVHGRRLLRARHRRGRGRRGASSTPPTPPCAAGP